MPIAQASLVWVDRETGLVDDGRSFSLPFAYYPRLSPGGDKLAVTREGRTWIYGLGSGSPGRPLTDSVSKTYVPVWTPDGGRVAFGDYRSGNPNLTWQAADGSDEAVTLLESTNRHYPADWFDKETLVFFEVSPKTRGNIMTLHLSETEPEVQSFLSTPNEERTPRLSPDGRWLAYASNESGAYNVYVRRFPEADMLQAVSTEGGGEPVWSADGTELFYRRGNYMMVVSVESGETLRLGTPEPLFEGLYATTPCCGASYVVAPDSESFLMLPLDNSAEIRVTRNWIEELKEKVNGQ
jgi:Tol biopolymer transport system component